MASSSGRTLVIVTGAAHGIGRAVVEAFLAPRGGGAESVVPVGGPISIFACDADVEGLRAWLSDCPAAGDTSSASSVLALSLDVTDKASLAACRASIEKACLVDCPAYDRVVLFNNAGIQFDVPMFFNPSFAARLVGDQVLTFAKNIEADMARKTLAVNTFGAFDAMALLFMPVVQSLRSAGLLSREACDLRIVTTGSGAGRLNLGRLLCFTGEGPAVDRGARGASGRTLTKEALSELAGEVLENTTDFSRLLGPRGPLEKFVEDYEFTVGSLRELDGAELEKQPWPVYGLKHGYYLSSYGFAKALLHQGMRILISRGAGSAAVAAATAEAGGPGSDLAHLAALREFVAKEGVAVCGCFPGVIRTRMNAGLKPDDAMLKEPSEGAAVLLRLAFEKSAQELRGDNSKDICLYNQQLACVEEYWEKC